MAKRFITPFAEAGDRAEISNEPIGSDVNMQTGYPAEYEADPVSDPNARFVERDKTNQIFNDITANIKEWQENTYPAFITAANNGGTAFAYKKGDRVIYNGDNYESLEDANEDIPTTSKWVISRPTDAIKAMLIAQGLSGNYGFFDKGFDYANVGDVGIDADGKIYTYVGVGAPNKNVTAGTNPIEPDYEVITFNRSKDITTMPGRKVSDTVRAQANVMDYGALEGDGNGTVNDQAFVDCLNANGAAFIPPGVTLRTAAGVKINSFQAIDFGGGSALEPGNDNIEVLKFQGDFSAGFNVRILNSGGFSGCIGLGFTPISPMVRTGQRYNRIYQSYIDGVHHACVLQCGDFVISEGFASGCWYNEIYGGEWRNLTGNAFYLKDGLNTGGSLTTDPATSNRNSFHGVSVHFCQGAGVKIESGETNTWYSYNYESCTFPNSIAVDIDEQAPGSPPNPNSHNRFICSGSESVTNSVNVNNKFTVFEWCTWERNTGDNWGGMIASQATEPSRMPYITPVIEREDYDFGRGRTTGTAYIKASRGVEFVDNGGNEVGKRFSIHDKGFEWQDVDLSSSITNASFVSSVAKAQKLGNWVDLMVRVRVGSVTSDVEIELPEGLKPANSYSSGLNSLIIPISMTNQGTELRMCRVLSSGSLRMEGTATLGGEPEFHIVFRYKTTDLS